MLAAGGAQSCAVVGSGIKCWGKNDSGQLGNPNVTANDSFARVDVQSLGGTAFSVAGGGAHGCAIVNGAVKCWGNNVHGQIGKGTTGGNQLTAIGAGMLAQVQAISDGDAHSCAIDNGVAKCWGKSDFGQVGDGFKTLRASPTQVDQGGNTNTVTAIAAGGSHTCEVIGGAAKCWGLGSAGQLGNGQNGDATTPQTITNLGVNVTAIASGTAHSCAIQGGAVLCWGSNAKGQLGQNITVTPSSNAPMSVSLGSTATAIVAGATHTCALLSTGEIKCWGDNASGQLGRGSLSPAMDPTPQGVQGISSGGLALVAGGQHTCAIAGGQIQCWGSNGSGQLGINPMTAATATPQVVTGISCSTTAPATCN